MDNHVIITKTTKIGTSCGGSGDTHNSSISTAGAGNAGGSGGGGTNSNLVNRYTEKTVPQIRTDLEDIHRADFSCQPFPGYIILYSGSVFKHLTLLDCEQYNIEVLGDVGLVDTDLINPGFPMMPSVMKMKTNVQTSLMGAKTELVLGQNGYIKQALILSGAGHLMKYVPTTNDRSDPQCLPIIADDSKQTVDDCLIKIANASTKTDRESKYYTTGYGNGVRGCNTGFKSFSDTNFLDEIWKTNFPMIAKKDRADYVMLMVLPQIMATEYCRAYSNNKYVQLMQQMKEMMTKEASSAADGDVEMTSAVDTAVQANADVAPDDGEKERKTKKKKKSKKNATSNKENSLEAAPLYVSNISFLKRIYNGILDKKSPDSFFPRHIETDDSSDPVKDDIEVANRAPFSTECVFAPCFSVTDPNLQPDEVLGFVGTDVCNRLVPKSYMEDFIQYFLHRKEELTEIPLSGNLYSYFCVLIANRSSSSLFYMTTSEEDEKANAKSAFYRNYVYPAKMEREKHTNDLYILCGQIPETVRISMTDIKARMLTKQTLVNSVPVHSLRNGRGGIDMYGNERYVQTNGKIYDPSIKNENESTAEKSKRMEVERNRGEFPDNERDCLSQNLRVMLDDIQQNGLIDPDSRKKTPFENLDKTQRAKVVKSTKEAVAKQGYGLEVRLLIDQTSSLYSERAYVDIQKGTMSYAAIASGNTFRSKKTFTGSTVYESIKSTDEYGDFAVDKIKEAIPDMKLALANVKQFCTFSSQRIKSISDFLYNKVTKRNLPGLKRLLIKLYAYGTQDGELDVYALAQGQSEKQNLIGLQVYKKLVGFDAFSEGVEDPCPMCESGLPFFDTKIKSMCPCAIFALALCRSDGLEITTNNIASSLYSFIETFNQSPNSRYHVLEKSRKSYKMSQPMVCKSSKNTINRFGNLTVVHENKEKFKWKTKNNSKYNNQYASNNSTSNDSATSPDSNNASSTINQPNTTDGVTAAASAATSTGSAENTMGGTVAPTANQHQTNNNSNNSYSSGFPLCKIADEVYGNMRLFKEDCTCPIPEKNMKDNTKSGFFRKEIGNPSDCNLSTSEFVKMAIKNMCETAFEKDAMTKLVLGVLNESDESASDMIKIMIRKKENLVKKMKEGAEKQSKRKVTKQKHKFRRRRDSSSDEDENDSGKDDGTKAAASDEPSKKKAKTDAGSDDQEQKEKKQKDENTLKTEEKYTYILTLLKAVFRIKAILQLKINIEFIEVTEDDSKVAIRIKDNIKKWTDEFRPCFFEVHQQYDQVTQQSKMGLKVLKTMRTVLEDELKVFQIAVVQQFLENIVHYTGDGFREIASQLGMNIDELMIDVYDEKISLRSDKKEDKEIKRRMVGFSSPDIVCSRILGQSMINSNHAYVRHFCVTDALHNGITLQADSYRDILKKENKGGPCQAMISTSNIPQRLSEVLDHNDVRAQEEEWKRENGDTKKKEKMKTVISEDEEDDDDDDDDEYTYKERKSLSAIARTAKGRRLPEFIMSMNDDANRKVSINYGSLPLYVVGTNPLFETDWNAAAEANKGDKKNNDSVANAGQNAVGDQKKSNFDSHIVKWSSKYSKSNDSNSANSSGGGDDSASLYLAMQKQQQMEAQMECMETDQVGIESRLKNNTVSKIDNRMAKIWNIMTMNDAKYEPLCSLSGSHAELNDLLKQKGMRVDRFSCKNFANPSRLVDASKDVSQFLEAHEKSRAVLFHIEWFIGQLIMEMKNTFVCAVTLPKEGIENKLEEYMGKAMSTTDSFGLTKASHAISLFLKSDPTIACQLHALIAILIQFDIAMPIIKHDTILAHGVEMKALLTEALVLFVLNTNEVTSVHNRISQFRIGYALGLDKKLTLSDSAILGQNTVGSMIVVSNMRQKSYTGTGNYYNMVDVCLAPNDYEGYKHAQLMTQNKAKGRQPPVSIAIMRPLTACYVSRKDNARNTKWSNEDSIYDMITSMVSADELTRALENEEVTLAMVAACIYNRTFSIFDEEYLVNNYSEVFHIFSSMFENLRSGDSEYEQFSFQNEVFKPIYDEMCNQQRLANGGPAATTSSTKPMDTKSAALMNELDVELDF